jgi:multiple sugar transport system substrate-binding protein
MRGVRIGRGARFLSFGVGLALILTMAGPAPAGAATVTDIWRAQVGAAGANGTATIQAYTNGTGSIALKLAKLRASTYLPVTLSKGTCSSAGSTLFRLPAIRTSSTGAANRTSTLTVAQVTLVKNATSGTGRIAIRIGSSTTGGVKCGVFTAPVSVGSSYSAQPGRSAFAAMITYCAGKTAVRPKINTVDHTQFKSTIETYLRGTPDTIFTWFAGERMRVIAAEGLSRPISDVWARIGGHYTDAVKAASTGADGKQYFVPISEYPWVVIYRRSLFNAKGYTVPRTLSEFIALAQKMQADGLVPLAFGDKDGWPAMGTFDILDMRMNGYQFHMDLMAGKAKWTDPRVEAVFVQWAKLLPYFQSGALDRTWQEAARSMIDKQAGMHFLGTFAIDQVTDPAVRSDFAMFPFPLLGNQYDTENAIDAPIDGLMLSRSPTNVAAAKTMLQCVSTGAAQRVFLTSSPTSVSAAKDFDTSKYTPFQQEMATIIGGSNKIAQFLDRDSRPDFSGPSGMQAFLKDFLANPSQDLVAYLARIQAFYDSLPPQISPG